MDTCFPVHEFPRIAPRTIILSPASLDRGININQESVYVTLYTPIQLCFGDG